MMPSIYVGGRYSNSPMRHKSSNKEDLRQFLEKQGRNTIADAYEADIYIALDHNEKEEKLLTERLILKKFSILYRSEPLCVLPTAYKPETIKLYNSVFSFGKSEILNDGMHWPQYFPDKEQSGWGNHDRLPKAVIINANKLSLIPSELYSLRRESIKKIAGIDLFGENWNSNLKDRVKILAIEVMKDPMANLVTFMGRSRYWFSSWPETPSPADKIQIMQRYKFALVIENELSYMSEKLFDAFFAGCIPIYIGPDIAHYGIPKGLVIQCKPTVTSLIEGFEVAKRTNFEDYQEQLEHWLKSESTKNSHEGAGVINRAIESTFKKYSEFTRANQL
jgi:hypothetical protein